jgi:hypothetical protein
MACVPALQMQISILPAWLMMCSTANETEDSSVTSSNMVSIPRSSRSLSSSRLQKEGLLSFAVLGYAGAGNSGASDIHQSPEVTCKHSVASPVVKVLYQAPSNATSGTCHEHHLHLHVTSSSLWRSLWGMVQQIAKFLDPYQNSFCCECSLCFPPSS